jgi:diaminopimelate decarboxylase
MINDNILTAIINQYGTPLYAYDLSKIADQVSVLQSILPKGFGIFYSMKSNPNLGILSFLKDFVAGVEVASEGELYLAQYTGVSSNQIIFVGPGKTKEELKYAICSNIQSIVVESVEELNLINEISRKYNKETKILIRINPSGELGGARIKMAGIAKQFGIDEECLGNIFNEVDKYKNIRIFGIHVYMGTQILDVNFIIESFRKVLEIAESIQTNWNIKLKVIDFGGGFGIPYFPGEQEMDHGILKEKLLELFQEKSRYLDFSQIKLIVESGRFLVAESGYFLSKILYKKDSRGKTFLITDGGSNNHASAAGIGRFIRHNFPVTVLNKENEGCKEMVDIVGPLCTPTDVLAQNVELPVTKEGDIITILKSGAYGLSASMTGFLSHITPAEVLFYEDKHWLVRERGKREDYITGQTVLNEKAKENIYASK